MNEYSCNKENMELLCKELETTNEAQATSFLRVDGGYCCLGIATEVYRKTTGDGKWRSTSGRCHSFIYNDDEGIPDLRDTQLPTNVGRWLGIGDKGDIHVNGTYSSAMYMNDTLNYNFKQIAHELRKTYLPETLINLPA